MRRTVDLHGHVAVITGAASGIGAAAAIRMAREGAAVHVCDRDVAGAEAVVEEIRRRGGSATPHMVDVTDAEALAAVADRVFGVEGRVDVLMNNAGIGHAGAIEDTSLDAWRQVVEVNLLGTANGVHAFAPRMVEQASNSVIINTASQSGLVPVARMVPYCASKYGVVGLSLALNAELSSRGVRVVALCPGVVDTAIISTTLIDGNDLTARATAQRFYQSKGVPPARVADDVIRAIRRPRLVVVSPASQVLAPYLLQRLSPNAMQIFARHALRVMGVAERAPTADAPAS